MTYRTRQHCLVAFYRASRIALRRLTWQKIQGAFRNQAYSGVRVINGRAY